MTGPPPLGALDPATPLPFGRGSVVRMVVAEPASALLVQRALVMEVAHPKVAAAVTDHSQFLRRPLSRAWVTADAALRLVFGDERIARGAVQQIYGVHDHIAGHREPDTSYTAHDASLLAWVWATLLDTAETAFTRWVRPFGSYEADAYYDEMRAFGRFLGIPDPLLPQDRHGFVRYLDDMLSGGVLGASDETRTVAHQVLWFSHWSVPPPLVRAERVLALATLDPRVLDGLEIRPGPADLRLGRTLDVWLGTYYRRLPRRPTIVPALYVMLRRPSIGLADRVRGVVAPARR
jgi:uncharacterized protein (DUF2236 family)